jgi:DNA-binding protein HU-beta
VFAFGTPKVDNKALKNHIKSFLVAQRLHRTPYRPIFAALNLSLNTNTMNKGELVASIADHAGLTQSQADAALSATLDSIQGALKSGDSVSLVGFGTFSATERPAREGRNPRTGETIQIAAKTVAKFKPGKKLSESLN